MVNKQTTILTIAGSDNTSGAGIQADIKTSYILGVYCLSAVTTVTSQNSKKISKKRLFLTKSPFLMNCIC